MAIDVADLLRVSAAIQRLGLPHAIAGGAVLPLLLDNPGLTPVRTTRDVDVIVEVLTRREISRMEEKLRALKFDHDMSQGAPRCRWIFEGVKVDVMPVEDPMGEMRTRWFDVAVRTVVPVRLREVEVRVVTAPCFVAMKMEAFSDRGQGDFVASHDVEDVIALVDGRQSLETEIAQAQPDLRDFVVKRLREWLDNPAFVEALPGHLAPDPGSQARLPLLRERLARIVR